MKRLFTALMLACLAWPAEAGTRVWGFYGWGPDRWSGGIDQIAAQARTIPNVQEVRLYDYIYTQQVANEISATPRGTRIVVYGYSCGANSTTLIGTAFNGRRPIAVIGMQPSIWCGGSPSLTPNVLAQNTYASCWKTLGLGCQTWGGNPHYLRQIYRNEWHGQADTDPAYQQDVLSAINRIANPGGGHHCDPTHHHCHAHTVIIHHTATGEITHHVIHHVPIR
jgi:hypothetical protein